MLHSRTLNTCINRIHERALGLVCNDYNSTFSELLKLDNSFTVHEKNMQTLTIEVVKDVHNNLSPEIMSEVFILKSSQKYCSRQIFQTRNVRTVYNGLETLSSLGPSYLEILE